MSLESEFEKLTTERDELAGEVNAKLKKMSDDFTACSNQAIKAIDCMQKFNNTSILKRKLYKTRKVDFNEATRKHTELIAQNVKSRYDFEEVSRKFFLVVEKILKDNENDNN